MERGVELTFAMFHGAGAVASMRSPSSSPSLCSAAPAAPLQPSALLHELQPWAASSQPSLAFSQPASSQPSSLQPSSSQPSSSQPSSQQLLALAPSAGDEPSSLSGAISSSDQVTEAIIDGTRRNLIMNGRNSSGYYGITYRSFQSRSRPYCAMVRGKHLGAFATAVEGAIAVWRYVDEQQLEPHVLLSSEPLGPCPISASAKRKRGKGCGGFQRRGHPTCQDGPIGDDGRPKWIKGVLFCGESACRAAAGVVNSQTRATDLARKRPRDPEAPTITLPNLSVTSMPSARSGSSAMEPQPSPAIPPASIARVNCGNLLARTAAAPSLSTEPQPLPSPAAATGCATCLSLPSQPPSMQPASSQLSTLQSLQPLPTQPQPSQPSPLRPLQPPPSQPSTSSSGSAVHQTQALQVLARRSVEMSTLIRFQREACLPLELEVALVPNLMQLLKAFNEASDNDVARLLQRGMNPIAGGLISRPLAQALTAATARIRSYQERSYREY